MAKKVMNVTVECSKEAELARILESIENIEKYMAKFDKTLHGNGQPGLVTDVVDLKASRRTVQYTLGVGFTIIGIGLTIVSIVVAVMVA